MSTGPDTLSSTRPADADAPRASDKTVARIVWAILWLTPFAVLVVAALLTPSPIGHSTHTQLGLPPCGFLVMTGLPCPGCGMTTAFAHALSQVMKQAVGVDPQSALGNAVRELRAGYKPGAGDQSTTTFDVSDAEEIEEGSDDAPIELTKPKR